jgi:hypothetical protein
MDKRLKAKLLYKFLKKHNALQRYCVNVLNYRRGETPFQGIEKDVLTMIEYSDCNIGSSFLWDSTKEGHEYWEDLNLQFIAYFYERRNAC